MGTVTNSAGKTIDFEAAVSIMDDELREPVRFELAPCADQEFFDAYCKRHLKKFGEEFEPDKISCQW